MQLPLITIVSVNAIFIVLTFIIALSMLFVVRQYRLVIGDSAGINRFSRAIIRLVITLFLIAVAAAIFNLVFA